MINHYCWLLSRTSGVSPPYPQLLFMVLIHYYPIWFCVIAGCCQPIGWSLMVGRCQSALTFLLLSLLTVSTTIYMSWMCSLLFLLSTIYYPHSSLRWFPNILPLSTTFYIFLHCSLIIVGHRMSSSTFSSPWLNFTVAQATLGSAPTSRRSAASHLRWSRPNRLLEPKDGPRMVNQGSNGGMSGRPWSTMVGWIHGDGWDSTNKIVTMVAGGWWIDLMVSVFALSMIKIYIGMDGNQQCGIDNGLQIRIVNNDGWPILVQSSGL